MSETRKDDVTADLLAKAYEMQRTDAAIALLRERDYWERRALQAEAALLARVAPQEGLDARATIIELLRGTVKPHTHGEYGCDCGPEDFGVSNEIADAISAHWDRAVLSVGTATPPAAETGEPVAFGFPNSSITEQSRWMMLREQVPANDQYGGALWIPLYLRSAASAPREVSEAGE